MLRGRSEFVLGVKICMILAISIIHTASSLPTRSTRSVDEPLFYEDYEHLRTALLEGRTVSFTVVPNLCELGSALATTDVILGLTSRQWTIEAAGVEGNDEEIHITGVHMEGNATDNTAWWVSEEIIIGKDNKGSYKSIPKGNNDAATPRAERLGDCKLGTGIKALDLMSVTATSESQTELVSVSDYDTLVSELKAGRDVVGWVDISKCNPDSVSTRYQGFAVHDYFIKNAGMTMAENAVLTATWLTAEFEISPRPLLPSDPTWNELRITIQSQSNEVTVAHSQFQRNQLSTTLGVSSSGFGVESTNFARNNLIQCAIQDGVNLFTRRYEQEEEAGGDLETIFSFLERGFPVHNLVHEGYCLDGNGQFLGNEVHGTTFQSWTNTRPEGDTTPDTVSLHHVGSEERENSVVLGEVTVDEVDGVTAFAGRHWSINTTNLSIMKSSESSCYVGSSTFLHVATESDSFRSFRNLEEFEKFTDTLAVIPSFDGIFRLVVTPGGGNPGGILDMRTSYNSYKILPQLRQLEAYSSPSLIMDEGNRLKWRTDAMTLSKRLVGSSPTVASSTVVTVDVLNGHLGFGDNFWTECVWASQFSDSDPGCTFRLLPSY